MSKYEVVSELSEFIAEVSIMSRRTLIVRDDQYGKELKQVDEKVEYQTATVTGRTLKEIEKKVNAVMTIATFSMEDLG